MAETIRERIEDNAIAGIKRARGDQGEVEAMSVDDLIKAEKHTAAAGTIARNPFAAIKRAVAVPPSAGRVGA